MIVPIGDLRPGDWVHVLFPNGDRVLGKVSARYAEGDSATAYVDPPGCITALTVREPLKTERLDIPPDPSTLPTLASVLRAVS